MEFCIKITEPDKGLFIVAESKHIRREIQARKEKIGKRKLVHVNEKELETQIALIEHFETVHSQPIHRGYVTCVELFNDHWSSTWYAFLKLLEEGNAYILDKENREVFSQDEIIKSTWREGTGEGMTYGGVLVTGAKGKVLIKAQTWLS